MRTQPAPAPKHRRFRIKHVAWIIFVLFVVVAYSILTLTRPFNELTPTNANNTLTITTPASYIPWPNYGQSAFGLDNGQVIATHGDLVQVPIASAAKLITALVVLQKKPLAANASGPTITIGDSDVSLYDKYVAEDGSVVPVSTGQTLSEREALEAMLLPSANNIADSLAIWAFGSIGAYTTYANNYVNDQKLTSTHVGSDASGFLPDSTSTANDLVKLGGLAMNNPAIAQIVGESSANIGSIGVVHNVDTLLGSNNIVGIKTGNSDQDGGVFVGAATTTVAGKPVTIISAIAGAPSLSQVLSDSANVLAVARTTFAGTTIVHKGSVLGTYKQADGSSIQAVAAADLNITILRGDSVKASVHIGSVSYTAKAGQVVGNVATPTTEFSNAAQVAVVLKQTPTKPSITYRLLHP